MRADKNNAFKLRLEGRSYNEISSILEIPKSTLSCWFTGLELPEKAKERIWKRMRETAVAALIKRNHAQTFIARQKARNTRNSSKNEIRNITKRELKMIGISIYWAEGYKRPKMHKGQIKTYHPVTLSNSDPNLVKIYLRFLRETCNVPEQKISGEIRVYEHQNAAYLLTFWNKTTRLSNLKTIRNGPSLSSKHIRPFNILPYGTIQIRVNSTDLYHRIMGWIDGLAQKG